MKVLNQVVTSIRNTDIHTTIIDCEKENAKLVVFVHGFCAERTEGGRFLTVGKKLAESGVSSICMDFPACGESTEPFENYCLTNMIHDVDCCVMYMKSEYSIDESHMGMVGYSMGGRFTCIYSSLHPEFKTIGLWAAAAYNGFENHDFLGNDTDKMKEEASQNGFAAVVNDFDGRILHLSKQFFEDMENFTPYDDLMEFTGNVILCHGDADITVPCKVSEDAFANLHKANRKQLLIVKNANHGFGLWDDHMEQSHEMTDTTTKFFEENL